MRLDRSAFLAKGLFVLVVASAIMIDAKPVSASERDRLLEELFDVSGLNRTIEMANESMDNQKMATKNVIFQSIKNDVRNFCCLNIDDQEINSAIETYLDSQVFDNFSKIMKKAYVDSFSSFENHELEQLISMYGTDLNRRVTDEIIKSSKYIDDYMTAYFANEYPHKIEQLKRDLRNAMLRRGS